IVRITRVKVGNRQAPQQQTETPPQQVGFLRLRPQKNIAAQCIRASGCRYRRSTQLQAGKPSSISLIAADKRMNYIAHSINGARDPFRS
ncbi:hypothetical protein, partial [Paraburkholderia sp. DHOC27]|uniref:hypothetical protein n=1 Tax=Paraburkholderia sp. DHOC27 TaxID=2303330 RepID=UPI001C70969F